LATSNVEIAYNQIDGCVSTGIALAMGLDQIAHDNTVVSAGNDAGGRSVCLGVASQGNAKPRLRSNSPRTISALAG
jgi:hypothetical protein